MCEYVFFIVYENTLFSCVIKFKISLIKSLFLAILRNINVNICHHLLPILTLAKLSNLLPTKCPPINFRMLTFVRIFD